MKKATLVVALVAVLCGVFVAFWGIGQVIEPAAANEPAEPLKPYSRTGLAYGTDSTETVLIGWVNARGSVATVEFEVPDHRGRLGARRQELTS